MESSPFLPADWDSQCSIYYSSGVLWMAAALIVIHTLLLLAPSISRTQAIAATDIESFQCDEEKPCSNCVRFGVPCDLAPGVETVVISDLPAVVSVRRGRGRPRKNWKDTTSTTPSSAKDAAIDEKSPLEQSSQSTGSAIPSPPASGTEASTPGSTTIAPLLTPPACEPVPLINIDDPEPLLHFVQHTAATLAGKGNSSCKNKILRFWEHNAPQMGLRWPFVLHLILSVAAFDLSRLALQQEKRGGHGKTPDHIAADPEGLRHVLLRRTRAEYLALAQQHFSSGLSGFTCLMAAPNPTNCGALYLSAVLVSYCTFAAGPTGPNDLLVCSIDDSDDHQSIPFVHGLRIIYASFRPEVLFAGLMAPLGPSGGAPEPEPQVPVYRREGFERIDWEPALGHLRQFINEGTDKDKVAACIAALDDLVAIFAANYGYGPEGSYDGDIHNQFVFGWLYRIRGDFIHCLCARDSRALLLVAYYAVLLDSATIVPLGWYIQGWSEHLVTRVGGLLSGEEGMDVWLEWPRKLVALQSGE